MAATEQQIGSHPPQEDKEEGIKEAGWNPTLSAEAVKTTAPPPENQRGGGGDRKNVEDDGSLDLGAQCPNTSQQADHFRCLHDESALED